MIPATGLDRKEMSNKPAHTNLQAIIDLEHSWLCREAKGSDGPMIWISGNLAPLAVHTVHDD